MAKLINEKIEIYGRKLKGESLRKLGWEFKVNFYGLEYLVRLLKNMDMGFLDKVKTTIILRNLKHQ